MGRKNVKGAARDRGTRLSDLTPSKSFGNNQMLSAREMKRIADQIAHMERAEHQEELVHTSSAPHTTAAPQKRARDSVPRSSYPKPIVISSHGHVAQAQVTPLQLPPPNILTQYRPGFEPVHL